MIISGRNDDYNILSMVVGRDVNKNYFFIDAVASIYFGQYFGTMCFSCIYSIFIRYKKLKKYNKILLDALPESIGFYEGIGFMFSKKEDLRFMEIKRNEMLSALRALTKSTKK